MTACDCAKNKYHIFPCKKLQASNCPFYTKIYIGKDISKEQLLLTGLYLCLSKDLLVQGTVDCFFY